MFYCDIELFGSEYILVMKSLASYTQWFLYSKIHPDDLFISYSPGSELKHKILDISDLYKDPKLEYLAESVIVNSYNEVHYYGRFNLLNEVIKTMNLAKTYGYKKSEVLLDKSEIVGDSIVDYLHLHSSRCFYKHSKSGKKFLSLEFMYDSLSVSFTEVNKLKLPRINVEKKAKPGDLIYNKVSREDKVLVSRTVNVKDVMLEQLLDSMDLSWYYNKETNTLLRDYNEVTNISDFEKNVISPLVYKIIDEHNLGNPSLLVGCDTETTGLNFYYTPHEKLLDNICSLQLSWEFDKGYNILLDMEYFDNCDRDYVLDRVSKIFRWEKGSFDYELYYDRDGNRLDSPTKVLLDRDWYLLGGHNIVFDSKVFRRHGYEIYFDEDTLQMAFSIAPTSFKVKKDLKTLTKHFLGISYPELSTLLGKGNEDKFKYLRDIRVANLYGCADVDMFRKVWFCLRELMGDRIYNSYKKIDSYLLNTVSESEYYGCRIDKELIKVRGEEIFKDLSIIEEFIYKFVGKMQLIRYCSSTGEKCTEEQMERAYYKFNLKGKEVLTVFYDHLKYPVTVLTKKKERSLNSHAITKLLHNKLDTPSDMMKENLISSNGKDVLISASKFNSYKYPLAYALNVYKSLEKEYTGYYKPFFNEDTGDRLLRPIKMANIETRRISCATQTVKKDIKKCVIAHADDFNLFDWDLAQVEARIFVSLAGDKEMIEKMRDPDRDYHTENAALINGLPPHLVPKDVRSKAKAIGFGVPYGLSTFKLCERMFTDVDEENMIKTRQLLSVFEDKNHISMDELKSYRERAHDLVEVSPELRRFWGMSNDTPVSMIKNKNGFYRYEDMTVPLENPRKMASVERAYGNFPIQSYAADFYKILLTRLHKRIRKEGLQDKIIFHMYIHDELLASFHKSIDPRYIVKLVKEECMVKLKNQTNYYLGINFGSNWNECKKDEAELPVKFVQRLCKDSDNWELMPWCDDPAGLFKPGIYQFKMDRVYECLMDYTSLKEGIVDLDEVLDAFENYTVRSYLFDLGRWFNPNIEVDPDTERLKVNKKGEYEFDIDDDSLSRICYVLNERYNGDSPLTLIYGGKEYSLDELKIFKDDLYEKSIENNSGVIVSDIIESEELDLDDLDENTGDAEYQFYSFDAYESYCDEFIYVDNVDDNEYEQLMKKAESILKFQEDEFKYVSSFGKTKILKLNDYSNLSKLIFLIQNSLLDKSSHKKYRVKVEIDSLVKTLPIEYNLVSDDKLEKALIELNESTKK